MSISCCWPAIQAGQRLVRTKVNLTAQNWISAFSAWLVTGACWMPSCTSWLVLVVLPVIMAISFSVLACSTAPPWRTAPAGRCPGSPRGTWRGTWGRQGGARLLFQAGGVLLVIGRSEQTNRVLLHHLANRLAIQPRDSSHLTNTLEGHQK